MNNSKPEKTMHEDQGLIGVHRLVKVLFDNLHIFFKENENNSMMIRLLKVNRNILKLFDMVPV